MGLKVLFSGDLGVLEAPYFFKSMALRVSDLLFFCFRLVFRSQIFQCS